MVIQCDNSGMKRLVLGGLFLLGVPGASWAQTILSLTATGTDIVVPDEMTARFNVTANAATAAAAQNSVNQTMAKALATINANKNVTATTGNYSVDEVTDGPAAAQKTMFQANQTLQLTIPAPGGKPPSAFMDLVSRLQQDGLLIQQLAGDLSASGEQTAEAAATVDAIHKLQTQANAVAQTLGDKVGDIKTIDIGSNAPRPVVFGAMRFAAATPAPAQSEPGPMTVTVTVNATIEFTVRSQ